MKKVHKPAMVARLWADQSQKSAKTATGTFFFEGDTIYSYGNHFPIARHVKTKRGHVILLTLNAYSKTTARHVALVRDVCFQFNVFQVYDIEAKPGALFKEYRKRVKNMIDADAKAKGRQSHILHHDGWLLSREANKFARHFGLKSRLAVS